MTGQDLALRVAAAERAAHRLKQESNTLQELVEEANNLVWSARAAIINATRAELPAAATSYEAALILLHDQALRWRVVAVRQSEAARVLHSLHELMTPGFDRFSATSAGYVSGSDVDRFLEEAGPDLRACCNHPAHEPGECPVYGRPHGDPEAYARGCDCNGERPTVQVDWL